MERAATAARDLLTKSLSVNQRDQGELMTKAAETIENLAVEHAAHGKALAEIDSRLGTVEQEVVAGPGRHRDRSGERSERPGALVLKDARLEQLQDGSAKEMRFLVKSFFSGQKADVVSSGWPDQRATGFDREVYFELPRIPTIRDLVSVRPTEFNKIEFVRGTRAGTAASQYTSEDSSPYESHTDGAPKARVDLSFTLASASVVTIACWTAASNQVLQDISELGDVIDTALRDALRLEEEEQLLKGDGTQNTIHGLVPQATPYNRAQSGDGYNDTLRRAITQLQLARGVPTGIVINPIGLENLELEKDQEGRYLMAFHVVDGGRTISWRVPVISTDAMEEDEFLVGDFQRAARLYDRMQAAVFVSTQHEDYFTRNLLAILAEERVALAVMRPQLLIHGAFG